jgi:hypothetical protein
MLNLVAQYKDLIKDFRVQAFDREGELLRFKAELILLDDSRIFIKEFFFQNGERKYAYHWADAAGKAICRWDNAPHWPNLLTSPHHKHIGEDVLESTEITASDVLNEVQKRLAHKVEEI